MTVCCEVCQHPACWKAEIDIQRKSLQNEYGYFNLPVYNNSSTCRYDARSECIVEIDGSLPTYKTLDLLESGFPSCDVNETPKLYEEDTLEDHDKPCEISSDKKEQAPESREYVDKRNASFPFTSKCLSNYLKKLCDRHKEVAKQEDNEKNDVSSGRHILFKTLRIEDVQSFGDEYTKVYTWVPGKKPPNEIATEGESKEKVIALKMIDGADLPTNCALSEENKHRHKLRSQTTGLSFRRKTVQMPPLGSEEHDDYIQLLRYIDLTRLRCNKISMNNQDVRIPSPLQTARVKLYESSDDNKTPKHALRTKYTSTQQARTQSADNTTEDAMTPRTKTMYIRNGVVLSKSPVLKRAERSKVTKRTPLPLTRVSVPKKAVKKLPLFDHCSSSIKKTDLPEVAMEPISSSENTSVLSSANPSLVGDVQEMLHRTAMSSPDMVRVPASSPQSMSSERSTSPTIHRMEKEIPTLYNIPSEDIIDSTMESRINLHRGQDFLETNETALQRPEKDSVEQSNPILGRSETKITDKDASARLYLDFDGEHRLHANKSHLGTRIAPSVIMISKASKTDHNERPAARRQSPTMSLGSKGSLDGWLLDKDIISRTYDKYQSFSPFKTPHCSAHVIRDDLSRNMDTRTAQSKRQILPPSLHNLDQYLPGEEDSLRTNTSFTTRCLSPSRSMFIRQQRQPPIENVPSEIIVSRFPLLPAITKSQRSARGDLFNHKQNGTDIAYHTPLPDTSRYDVPDTSRYDEQITSFVDDDYEEIEEIEEVLLTKEVFSSFDCRVNNSPQPVSSDLQVIGATDPEAVNYDPSFQPVDVDYTVKNEKLMDSLNVSNRDILRPPSQYGSNFLLLPTNVVTHSAQHDDYSAEESDTVTSGMVDDNEKQSNSPVTCTHTDISGESVVDDETVEPLNKHIPVTDQHISISDGNIIITENIEIYRESVEPFGEMRNVSRVDVDYNDDRQRESSGDSLRGSLGDSLQAFTPLSSDDDNLTLMSSLTIDGQITDDQCTEICSITPSYEVKLSEIKNEYPVDTSEVNAMESDDNEDSNVSINDSEQHVTRESDATTCSIEVDESIEIKEDNEENEVNQIDADDDDVIIENNEVREEIKVIEEVTVIDESEMISEGEIINPVASKISFDKKDLESKPSDLSSRGKVSSFDLYSSTAHLPEEPIQSVMTDIFSTQLKEKSSLFLTPSHAENFTEGLDLDMEVEEEIVRAIHGLEEFVLDSYEVEEEEN